MRSRKFCFSLGYKRHRTDCFASTVNHHSYGIAIRNAGNLTMESKGISQKKAVNKL